MAESQPVTRPDPKQLSFTRKALGTLIFIAAMIGAIFLIITAVALVVQFVWGAFVGIAEMILPSAAQNLLLWIADVPLAISSPYLRWLNAFATTWGGLLTIAGLILAVILGRTERRREAARGQD
jgi:hypothetical protein